jgi:hypothetical protein
MNATTVNGEPRVVLTFGVNVIRVATLRVRGIALAVDMTNNPDDLSHWSMTEVEQTASRASLVPPATGPTLGTTRGYAEEIRRVSNERLRSGY